MAIYVANGSDDYAESVTGGSANAKGSWVEMLASTAETIGEVRINPLSSNQQRNYLIDIGTGPGGSESVLVADIILGVGGVVRVTNPAVSLPVSIASGTRIAARVQATAATTNVVRLSVMLVGGTGAPTNPFTYGAVTGSTAGTTVDAGGTADTKGSYSEITSATSAAHTWVTVVVSGRGNTAPQVAFFALDVATGAGGSETVQIPDLCIASNGVPQSFSPTAMGFPLTIASGTRIAARLASSTNDATDRLLDVEVIGGSVVTSGGSGGGEVSHVFVG